MRNRAYNKEEYTHLNPISAGAVEHAEGSRYASVPD